MIDPRVRESFYAATPYWWSRYEPSRALSVPTPPVYSYFSNLSLLYDTKCPAPTELVISAEDKKFRRKVLATIGLSEFVVMAFIRFLTAASEFHINP